MRTTWTLVLAGTVALGCAEARADKSPTPNQGKALDCSRAGKRKARAVADKAVKAKDYRTAIATLQPFKLACGGDGADALETAWLLGDLAVAYEKDGQYLACKSLVEPLVYPKSDVARLDNDKLMSALQYNLDRCAKEFDAEYASLTSSKCPLTIDDAAASAALPAALAPKGARSACVALVPGDAPSHAKGKDGDDGLPDVVCPQVAVVWKGTARKLNRQALTGIRLDETFCCGLDQIAVGVKDGQTLVRIGADEWVRECHGGTATSSLDSIYAWKGNALTLVVDASNDLW